MITPEPGRWTTEPTEAGVQRARALLEIERWADAAVELGRVLQVRPYDVEALCLLAVCHGQLDDAGAMLDAAGRALAVRPEDEWALRLRARALLKLRRRREATAAARAAVASAPDDWQTHATLAEVLAERGGASRLLRARLAADMVLRLAPGEPEAHVLDAFVQLRMSEFDAARQASRRALALDPRNQAALHNLAAAELGRERIGTAVRGFTAALAESPDDRRTADAHGRSARAVLWRLFDGLAVATVVHVVLLALLGETLGVWRRPVALTTAAAILVGFGWLSRRTWRAQPASVRWRLRSQVRQAGVAMNPVLLTAAALGLTVNAWGPTDDSVADGVRVLTLAVVFGTLGVRGRNLAVRRAGDVVERLGYRVALATLRSWARTRRR